ncbi:hypothetical protein [Candidatus Avelusimicrobium fimicolum]|uniref:hypothetical protein n=1 Tax=Candidatus Avelusimicrobium fimicolum TaxID=3416216 RepID=UPI003D1118C4
MTAEIAVMNKNGIALAADSAVTIGGKKVYNSANKLFTLSKYHPVGILIYGSAELNGIPWELIIKEYREQIKDTNFDTIQNFYDDFKDFLKHPRWRITEEMQGQTIRLLVSSFCEFFHAEYVKRNYGKNPSVYENELFRDTLSEFDNLLKDVKSNPYKNFSNYNLPKFIKTIYQGAHINISDAQIQQLLDLFVKSLNSNYPFFNNISGIAIAGYGKEDIYPSLFSFETAGFVCNQLHLMREYSSKITENNNAVVRPFAQDKMAVLFMDGIHPECKDFLDSQAAELVNKLSQKVIQNLSPHNSRQEKIIQAQFNDIYRSFIENITQFCRSKFSNPRVNSIANLSKTELAKMAESLVELHALEKQVSMEVETVGGPVDVAVISKHDGFIWLKRKLYFNPELNHCFFNKYMK